MSKHYKDAALILVDIQNDFCPEGALAVQDGDEVVPVVNRLLEAFPLVIATMDWHPVNHISFKAQGGIWNPHCVQNSEGAAFHPLLEQSKIDLIFHKAFTQDKDAYSAFEGVDEQGSPLHKVLKAKAVRKIFIAGLATDYCVKETALDGLKNGYEVFVIEDAVRSVDVQEGDGEKALQEMIRQGAMLINSEMILRRRKTAQLSGD
jgi:nicotinamidase/pyrazinamidase